MICKNCGNTDQQKFCPNCGEKQFNAHDL